MTIFDDYFPLGLGTSRFPVSGPTDNEGIEKSVKLLLAALDMGVNYIDTAFQYSSGTALDILEKAFRQTNKQFDVTVKVSHSFDKTCDEARARVEQSLNTMGLNHAKFFVCWTVFSYDEFEKIMSRGGIYDGAVKLKNERIIDHICLSAHTSPDDTIKIIKSGAFEGITISYSPLHAAAMQPVLDAALEYNTGVAVMNPLGGGIIAQNKDYFSFIKNGTDESTVIAALRFAKSHPAVNIVLSGVSSEKELNENIKAFTETNDEPNSKRLSRILKNVNDLKDFCTGCNYCKDCPENIPISYFMQSRNALLFNPTCSYNRSKPDELLYDIQIFRKLQLEFRYITETAENPCIRCGKCESLCTQRLGIINALEDTYNRAQKTGFSLESKKNRIKELIKDKNYKKVGLYPSGGFANAVMKVYNDNFGNPDFEWLQFNSDPKLWGKTSGDILIHSPHEIKSLQPDIIIVTTYRFDDVIYNELQKYKNDGIQIEKLHSDLDVPWIY